MRGHLLKVGSGEAAPAVVHPFLGGRDGGDTAATATVVALRKKRHTDHQEELLECITCSQVRVLASVAASDKHTPGPGARSKLKIKAFYAGSSILLLAK